MHAAMTTRATCARLWARSRRMVISLRDSKRARVVAGVDAVACGVKGRGHSPRVCRVRGMSGYATVLLQQWCFVLYYLCTKMDATEIGNGDDESIRPSVCIVRLS